MWSQTYLLRTKFKIVAIFGRSITTTRPFIHPSIHRLAAFSAQTSKRSCYIVAAHNPRATFLIIVSLGQHLCGLGTRNTVYYPFVINIGVSSEPWLGCTAANGCVLLQRTIFASSVLLTSLCCLVLNLQISSSRQLQILLVLLVMPKSI